MIEIMTATDATAAVAKETAEKTAHPTGPVMIARTTSAPTTIPVAAAMSPLMVRIASPQKC